MLPKTGFLSVASPGLLEILNAISIDLKLAPQQTLFAEHDPGDALYVVKKGAIEISILYDDGRKLGLEIMRDASVFGEIALFDPGPRTATAMALTETELVMIRNEDLLREIDASPELALELLHLAGARMRLMNRQLHEYVFLPLPARLARKVLHLTGNGLPGVKTFSLSQTDLADFTGATREAVSKTLSIWKQKGIVETGRGKLTVHDRSALQRLAGLEEN